MMTSKEAVEILDSWDEHMTIEIIEGKPTICYSSEMKEFFEDAIKAFDRVTKYRKKAKRFKRKYVKLLTEIKQLKTVLATGYPKDYQALYEYSIACINAMLGKGEDE